MKAKNLTKPRKKKCSNDDCINDLPNTMFAPPVKSLVTNKEICVNCKVAEAYGGTGPRSVEI
jgi:hypothetical protein